MFTNGAKRIGRFVSELVGPEDLRLYMLVFAGLSVAMAPGGLLGGAILMRGGVFAKEFAAGVILVNAFLTTWGAGMAGVVIGAEFQRPVRYGMLLGAAPVLPLLPLALLQLNPGAILGLGVLALPGVVMGGWTTWLFTRGTHGTS